MNKAETIKALSEELDFTQKRTEDLYNELVQELSDYLANDISISIPEFGSFHSDVRKAYKSFNPHYRKMMLLPTKKVVRFSQSIALKDEFNKAEL